MPGFTFGCCAGAGAAAGAAAVAPESGLLLLVTQPVAMTVLASTSSAV